MSPLDKRLGYTRSRGLRFICMSIGVRNRHELIREQGVDGRLHVHSSVVVHGRGVLMRSHEV
jgi:hypothetical protein